MQISSIRQKKISQILSKTPIKPNNKNLMANQAKRIVTKETDLTETCISLSSKSIKKIKMTRQSFSSQKLQISA